MPFAQKYRGSSWGGLFGVRFNFDKIGDAILFSFAYICIYFNKYSSALPFSSLDVDWQADRLYVKEAELKEVLKLIFYLLSSVMVTSDSLKTRLVYASRMKS